MRCTLSAHDLREALAACQLVAGKGIGQDRPAVRIDVGGEIVRLRARSSTGTATVKLAPTMWTADALRDGSITVDPRFLSQAAKALMGDEIELDAKDGRLRVSDGRTVYILLGDDDLELDDAEHTHQAIGEFAPDALRSAVERAASGAAREATRYAIHGVLLEVENGEARFVATDGRRLHLTRLQGAAEGADTKAPLVVPADLFRQACKAMGSEDRVRIISDGNRVSVSNGTVSIGIPMLEARFPDYAAVIPSGGALDVSLDAEDVAGLVSRVGVMSPRDMRVVRLEFRDGKLLASAESSDQGRADDSIACVVDGEHSVCVNADYFVAALKAMDSDKARFRMTDDAAPMRFDAEGVTVALMPISGS